MIATVLKGPPGSRKTQTMLTEMLEASGRYLVSVPRIALMDELADFVSSEAAGRGISIPKPTLIHGSRTGRGDVRRQMSDAAQELADADHAIVFITHEGLRIGDLTEFAGWHARIDEVPDGLVSDSFEAGAAFRCLEPLYRLEPVGDDQWWHVELRGEALRAVEVMNDAAGQSLASFHKYAAREPGVFVNVGDWADVRGRKRKVQWWSLWSPLVLEHFASVTIAGASFEHSLCYHATNRWFGDQVTFEDRVIALDTIRARPQVRIHYFTRGHTGSTTFWARSEGRGCLNQICRYLEKIGGVDFWSGNTVVSDYMEHWFPGKYVPPKLAGTNALIDKNSCAYIYSSKARDADEAILDVFGLDREQIKRSREIEDIIQFVMRGAIRRPEFDGGYDVYLYDLTQATALERYLRDNQITDDVILEAVEEAGFLDYERSDMKSIQVVEVDPQTKAEHRSKNSQRKAKQRANERAAKEAAGTLRPRGRPRSTAGGSAPT